MVPLHAVAYEHAAALIGRTPGEVSRHPQLLAEAHTQCHRRYQTAGAVIGIDIYNLEAEALGATVGVSSEQAVPVVTHHPYTSVTEITDQAAIDINRSSLAVALQAADLFADQNPGAAVGIPMAGPYSVAAGLTGMVPLLCDLAEDPEKVRDVLLQLTDRLQPWYQAVRRSGHRPVIFDSGVAPPLLPPQAFHDTIGPALQQMLASLDCQPSQSPALIIGGDTLAIVDDLMSLAVASIIAPQETDQPAFISRCRIRHDMHVRVNMDSRVFAQNDWAPIEQEWRRAADLAESAANASVGTGVLPYDACPALVERLVARSASAA